MPKQLRYHIYPLWMWLVVIIFIVLGVYVIHEWRPGGVTPISPIDSLIALAPLLAIICFLVRLFWTKNGGTCFETLVLLCLGVMLSIFLMPNIEASRTQVRWQSSRARLKTIGVAIHSYHQKQGSFPPAEMFDSTQNAEKNWQTILIDNLAGELEESDFQFTHEEGEPNYYFAVVGESTAWTPYGKEVRLDDIADPANTAIAIGILDIESKSSLGKDTKILLDDLISGKVSWEDQIAVYPYQHNRFSKTQPSASLLMADSTLRHYVGVPSPEELHWLFDIREKAPNTLPTEPFEGRVYFQERKQLLSRMIAYRVWQASLFILIIAIFLPRKPRKAKVRPEPSAEPPSETEISIR